MSGASGRSFDGKDKFHFKNNCQTGLGKNSDDVELVLVLQKFLPSIEINSHGFHDSISITCSLGALDFSSSSPEFSWRARMASIVDDSAGRSVPNWGKSILIVESVQELSKHNRKQYQRDISEEGKKDQHQQQCLIIS